MKTTHRECKSLVTSNSALTPQTRVKENQSCLSYFLSIDVALDDLNSLSNCSCQKANSLKAIFLSTHFFLLLQTLTISEWLSLFG